MNVQNKTEVQPLVYQIGTVQVLLLHVYVRSSSLFKVGQKHLLID